MKGPLVALELMLALVLSVTPDSMEELRGGRLIDLDGCRTNYGQLTQNGRDVKMRGGTWIADGWVRHDNSLVLVWTFPHWKQPSGFGVYRLVGKSMEGCYGRFEAIYLDDDGNLVGDTVQDAIHLNKEQKP